MTRPMALRSVAWRGERVGRHEFVGTPPRAYERYRVTGTATVRPDAWPELEVIIITDKDTGAEVTVRGDSVTLTAPGDATPEYVKRLWADARHLAALARRHGRPPGLTDITDEDQVRSVVRELRAQGRRPTQANVAAMSGAFTVSALRNYLRVNGRKWSEIIDT